jgi:hypothetical protein
VDRRPFEIVVGCEMAGFPTGMDIERVNERITNARRSRPNVVQGAASPPAIYRDSRYILEARFIVWAENAEGAARSVEDLLRDAGVECRMVVPSGRALTGLAVSPPPETKPTPGDKAGRPRGKKQPARHAKPRPRAARSRAARARTAKGRGARARTGKSPGRRRE